jgi:hypothetical protein
MMLLNLAYKEFYFKRIVFLFLSILGLGFSLLFFLRGPAISYDTVIYLGLASKAKEGAFPVSGDYSPGYSLLIGSLAKVLPQSLDTIAIGLQLVMGLIFCGLMALLYQRIWSTKDTASRMYSLIVGAMTISSWWVWERLLYAHADMFFLLLSAAIWFLLTKWHDSGHIRFFIMAGSLAVCSIWVKYNALVFIPFFAVFPFFYFGFSRKAWIGLPFSILMILAYWAFKSLNQGVIGYLETDSIRKISLLYPGAFETWLVNLANGGRALIEVFFSRIFSSLLKYHYYVLFLLGLGFFACWEAMRSFSKQSLIEVYALWVIGYLLSFLILQQLVDHQETNTRTLSHAAVLLVPILLVRLYQWRKRFAFGILLFMFLAQLTYLVHASRLWYQKGPATSFYHAIEFAKTPTFQKVKEIAELYEIEPSNIFVIVLNM